VQAPCWTRLPGGTLGRRPRRRGHACPWASWSSCPRAAVIADILAHEVDFFAIGTNDLIQYMLAIDRANEHVAYLYRPLHPALLRMLKIVVRPPHRRHPVSMCGEMAGDAFYTAVLVGLGLDELSMNAVSIPLIKTVVRSLDTASCRQLVADVLSMGDAPEIEVCVARRVKEMLRGQIPIEVFDPDRQPQP
jgi:phosphotransferase system enzyme I (PtsI)